MDVAVELTGMYLRGSQIISNCTTSLAGWHTFSPKVNVFLDISRSEFQKQTNNDCFALYGSLFIAFYTRFMRL